MINTTAYEGLSFLTSNHDQASKIAHYMKVLHFGAEEQGVLQEEHNCLARERAVVKHSFVLTFGTALWVAKGLCSYLHVLVAVQYGCCNRFDLPLSRGLVDLSIWQILALQGFGCM